MTSQKNNPSKIEIQNLISEIRSLESDLEEYKKHIQKIKDAPYDKDADVVGAQHEELVAELEDIANKLEELPKKWEKETKD
ncbi:MAG: hypothetical protein KAI72_10845 [Candidatus Pacebacteria bacterium]|nr:hypothetical protein [Candidatus Paceibacterota bacterium]